MGVKERKERQKEELRQLILTAAMKLFVEKGVEETTIRNIADAIQYSIGTVYLHFKDKDEILYTLHSAGFLKLGAEFKVLSTVAEPMERLKAMGLVYINFAKNNSYLYELMFSSAVPMHVLQNTKSEEWAEGKGTFSVLKDTIVDCLKKGYFKNHDAEALSFIMLSTVHGMCSLKISRRTEGVNLANPETIVEKAYGEFLKILDKI